MRIVNREEFLAIPAPVVYREVYKDSRNSGLAIKTGNHTSSRPRVREEWECLRLNPHIGSDLDHVDYEDLVDTALAGEAVNLTSNLGVESIDGRYVVDDTVFAVLELDEVRQLHALIGQVIAAAE